MPPGECGIPAADLSRKEDRVRAFLLEKASGLAELYDAARMARHYAAVPGVGLLLSHLVREIGNGLVNVVLDQDSRTDPTKLLRIIAKEWATVEKTLGSGVAPLPDSPEKKPLDLARAAISEAVEAHKSSDQGARRRAGLLFSAITGLPPRADDPTPTAWFENVRDAVPFSHFQATKRVLPVASIGLERLDKLEQHLKALTAGATEGLDDVEALLEEMGHDA